MNQPRSVRIAGWTFIAIGLVAIATSCGLIGYLFGTP